MMDDFKVILTFPNYSINKDGIVINNRNNKILSHCKDRKGYHKVGLYRNGKLSVCAVHRLVAMTFIPNPNGYEQVNHKDEDKNNNNIDNLEWCNAKHNANHGTRNKRIGIHNETVIVGYTNNIKTIYKSIKVAMTITGYSRIGISQVLSGLRNSIFGTIFVYGNYDDKVLLGGKDYLRQLIN